MPMMVNEFKKIAVAVSFSPMCEAVVAEAKNLKQAFGSNITFIHVGKVSLQEEQYLKHLLHRFELDTPNEQLLWLDGDPVEAILHFTKTEDIDLIVAGTLEKQSLLKYIFGGVARQLSRKTHCSMLMLCEPTIKATQYKHIVTEGSDHLKTKHTIASAVCFAKAFKANKVDIIQETDLSKLALIRSTELKANEADAIKEDLLTEEDKKLQDWIKQINCGNLNIAIQRMEGKPGYVITEFARAQQADLLVLNGPDRPFNLLDRVFPHDIEFALADLPCNLLLVQPKNDQNY